MTFIEYLKSKRTFIIIWLSIQGIALFVNLFKIEGKTEYSHTTFTEQRTEGRYPGTYNVTVDRYANILTTEPNNFYGEKGNSSYFWPFVKFSETNKYLNSRDYNTYYEHTSHSFKGIFYRYDVSEFIAYNVILLLVFYFMWSGKKSSTKP